VSPDRAQQDRVGRAASGERFLGKRCSGRVNRAAPEEIFRKLKAVAELCGAVLQDAHGDPHDFRANPVTRQKHNLLGLGSHGVLGCRRGVPRRFGCFGRRESLPVPDESISCFSGLGQLAWAEPLAAAEV